MKIKAFCRKDKTNKNGTAPLFIRFTDQRSTKFVSIGLSVEPCFWDFDTQMLTADCPERQSLQNKIDSAFNTYDKKIKRLEALEIEVNFDTLFGARAKLVNCSLQDYFSKVIDALENAGKFGSASKHRSTLSMLNQFRKNGIRFDEIDPTFLRDFETFLRGKGNNGNSLATKFSLIKAIYNRAITEEIFAPKSNPFVKYKVGSLWTKTRKRAITKPEIQKLIEHQIPHVARHTYATVLKRSGVNIAIISESLGHSDLATTQIYLDSFENSQLDEAMKNLL